MEANQVRVDDLFAFCEPRLAQWQQPRNVHFRPEGYAALARQVASVIAQELAETGK